MLKCNNIKQSNSDQLMLDSTCS